MGKRIVLTINILFLFFIFTYFYTHVSVFAQMSGINVNQHQQYLQGIISKVDKKGSEQEATIQITTGPEKGKTYVIPLLTDEKTKAQIYSPGDEVIVLKTQSQGQPDLLYIVDFVRTKQLIILTILFVAVVLVVGKMHGLLSVFSMVYSFLIIGQFIIPNIVVGNDPVFVSLMGGLLISPVTFYLSHGFNKKTTVAIIGTVSALVLTGILSLIFVSFAKLTGITSDEALFVKNMINQDIDLRSLLLAGMIIGLLGILDDITVSQAAIVEKLIKTNEKLNIKEVFFHAMDIGKDHIASLVNTLVLVYAGASLPLFLLFYNSGLPFSQAISNEVVATEIVRTLIGSIGLVAAVPLTTLLACIFMKRD